MAKSTEKDPREGVAGDDTRVSAKKHQKLKRKHNRLRLQHLMMKFENELMKAMLSSKGIDSSNGVRSVKLDGGTVGVIEGELTIEKVKEYTDKMLESALLKALDRGNRIQKRHWIRHNEDGPDDMVVLIHLDNQQLCLVRIFHESLGETGMSINADAMDGEGMAKFMSQMSAEGFEEHVQPHGPMH